MRKKNRLSLFIILTAALLIGVSWGANQSRAGHRQPGFTTFSRGESGISLLYDTLRHMQFPVNLLFQPVGYNVSVNDAVVIVQPVRPRVNDAMAREILEWVVRGGHLIYLENAQTTIMDRALWGEYYTENGGMRLYPHGMGMVLVGSANSVININMMENPSYGEKIAEILTLWNPGTIYFAEYYHGFHRERSFFSQLPVWLQLTAFQIVIAVFLLMWHMGKRFGNPIPLYEEIERKENEQIFALARLYRMADRRK